MARVGKDEAERKAWDIGGLCNELVSLGHEMHVSSTIETMCKTLAHAFLQDLYHLWDKKVIQKSKTHTFLWCLSLSF